MVDVGVADEDVADLMGDARGQTRPVTEIEQQAAPLVAQAQVQQRIAEDAVDEGCRRRADPCDGTRAAGVVGAGVRPHVGRRQVHERRAEWLCRGQQPRRVALGVAQQQPLAAPRSAGQTHAHAVALPSDDLAERHGAVALQHGALATDPGRGDVGWRRRAHRGHLGKRQRHHGGFAQVGVPQAGACPRALPLAGATRRRRRGHRQHAHTFGSHRPAKRRCAAGARQHHGGVCPGRVDQPREQLRRRRAAHDAGGVDDQRPVELPPQQAPHRRHQRQAKARGVEAAERFELHRTPPLGPPTRQAHGPRCAEGGKAGIGAHAPQPPPGGGQRARQPHRQGGLARARLAAEQQASVAAKQLVDDTLRGVGVDRHAGLVGGCGHRRVIVSVRRATRRRPASVRSLSILGLRAARPPTPARRATRSA